MSVLKIRRWVHRDGKLTEITADDDKPRQAGAFFMPDIKEFISPIDGEVISSRSKLRAHERKHNVRQAGDFKPGELIREERKRVEKSMTNDKGVEFKWY